MIPPTDPQWSSFRPLGFGFRRRISHERERRLSGFSRRWCSSSASSGEANGRDRAANSRDVRADGRADR